ncbi:MAG: OmpA family protein [Proteobacteria bacterium]|nr:OmpA family protein [Pseudomonadota bacterium]MDA0847477.1 OmpA family protein [Pseudomonadota bacterium]
MADDDKKPQEEQAPPEEAVAEPPPPAEEEALASAADEAEEKKCEECPECPPVGAPAWMATFADMATLLMAFFVLILSFAEMNVPKFKQISGSLKNSFGVQRLIPTVEPPKATSLIAQQFSPAVAEPTPVNTVRQQTTDETQREVELKTETKTTDEATEKAAKAVEKSLSQEIAKGLVEVKTDGQKVVVQINPPVAKNPGAGGGAGEKGEKTAGVVPQEQVEIFAKVAEAQSQVTAQVEVRQAPSDKQASPAGSNAAGKSGSGADQAEKDAQFERIKNDLAKEIAAGQAEVMRDGSKIVIRLAEQGSFVSGQADLQPTFLPLLQKVGKTISDGKGSVKVEGHTDNVPVIENPKFKSNWDLSAARSSAVADFLSSRAGVTPNRISVSGHADTRPLDNNATQQGRSRNRRIEVIVDG